MTQFDDLGHFVLAALVGFGFEGGEIGIRGGMRRSGHHRGFGYGLTSSRGSKLSGSANAHDGGRHSTWRS